MRFPLPRLVIPALCSYVGILLLMLGLFLPGISQAEWYVAGYGGWSAPNSLKDVTMDELGQQIGFQDFPGANSIPPLGTLTQSLQTSDVSLKQSPIYGGKAGYFFSDEGFQWLGVEVEAFTSEPKIKSQTLSANQNFTYIPNNPQPPGLCVPGIDCLAQGTATGTIQLQESSMRLITVAFNVVARYPGKTLQPYVGVGAGAFYFKSTGQIEGSQVVPGLNASAGLKILATEEWGVFLEGKYNLASISNFDPAFGLSGQYSAFSAVGGLAYHF